MGAIYRRILTESILVHKSTIGRSGQVHCGCRRFGGGAGGGAGGAREQTPGGNATRSKLLRTSEGRGVAPLRGYAAALRPDVAASTETACSAPRRPWGS